MHWQAGLRSIGVTTPMCSIIHIRDHDSGKLHKNARENVIMIVPYKFPNPSRMIGSGQTAR